MLEEFQEIINGSRVYIGHDRAAKLSYLSRQLSFDDDFDDDFDDEYNNDDEYSDESDYEDLEDDEDLYDNFGEEEEDWL